MELNEKMIGEIAGQLGISSGKNMGRDALSYLSSKSDAELEREILKIKQQLKANNVTYDKSQRVMLQRVIELLSR